MTAIVYSTISDVAQSTVYSILNGDATVLSLAGKILDGSATGITREQSSFVLVHTPSVSEESVTAGKNRRVTISMDVDCLSKKESVARRLSDAIRAALATNSATLNAALLRTKRIVSSSVGSVDLPSGNVIDTRHIIILTVQFTWFGREV